MVSWLEVIGLFDKVELGKMYWFGFKIFFIGDVIGWDKVLVFMFVKVGKKGKIIWKRIKFININFEKFKSGILLVNILDEIDGRFEIFVSFMELII